MSPVVMSMNVKIVINCLRLYRRLRVRGFGNRSLARSCCMRPDTPCGGHGRALARAEIKVFGAGAVRI